MHRGKKRAGIFFEPRDTKNAAAHKENELYSEAKGDGV